MKPIINPAVALLFSLTFAYASESGTVSIIVLKDGKPLKNSDIIFDNKKFFKTDKDGWIFADLPSGNHQLQLLGKEESGKNLGYIKKPFLIKSGKDTLIIASFDKDNTIKKLDIDIPLDSKKDAKSQGKKDGARNAILTGRILINKSKTPISGARIFIKGTSIDTKSDKNGYFSVKVPSNVEISLSVIHSAYSSKTIDGLKLKKGEKLSQKIKLTPASMELEEFVVLSPKVEGSIASVMAEEKNTNSISNILGSEEISKKGDSSAAGALKRVTGITLVDGKSIFVRGLGDRYSNVELNSLPLPSPDPTKRIVPLDIFPASVIGSLKVQKSSSADIPSSFGGGYINIRTKDKSDKNFIKVSMSLKANDNTGKNANTYKGGASDFSGYDDGYRQLDSSILNNGNFNVGDRPPAFTSNYFSKDELLKMTKNFVNRDYSINKEKLPFGGSGSLEGSYTHEINKDQRVSFFGNYGYSQEHTSRVEEFFGYDMGSDGTLHKKPDKFGTNEKSSSTFSHGGMFNIGYSYEDVLNLKFTKLYTLSSKKTTRVVDGIIGSNYDHMIKAYLDWEERELDTNQLSAEFFYNVFGFDNDLSGGIEYATARLSQPNNFYYSRVFLNGSALYDTQTTNSIASRLASDDTLVAGYLKNKTYVDFFSEDDFVEIGLNGSFKERISRQNKFFLQRDNLLNISNDALSHDIERIYDDYIRGEISYDDLVFKVQPLFTPADYFDANVDEVGGYVSGFISAMKMFEINYGIKYVNITQTVDQYEIPTTNNPNRAIQKVAKELIISDIYPSLSIKYKMDDSNHLDFAASKTYIMPDFREFTDGEYMHPYDVATVQGNTDLVNTEIFNADLKYSHYISDKESIKIGAFFKYLDKPIEDVMLPSSSLPIYSFKNADFATLYGIEINGRKDLSIIKEGLEDFYISGNISFTNSSVTLTPEQEKIYTTKDRQLQGLSKFVINTTFGYDTKKRSFAISYNKMGERVRKVGLIDDGKGSPDYKEIPPSVVDFTWSEIFGKDIKVGFKAKNILDAETVWKQGDRVTKRFKKGRRYSLGFSYKFTY